MKSSALAPKIHPSYSDLLAAARHTIAKSLIDAANTDSAAAFPEKTLQKIKAAHLLTACISSDEGGRDLGIVTGSHLAMLQILQNLGAGNLVMGRVVEGHFNAQLLIDQFGTEKQKKKWAKEAVEGKLFGVWNTQAADGVTLKEKGGKYFLNGSKTFTTGSDYVFRPIVTASFGKNSWQMCVLPLDEILSKSDSKWWSPMGMKASRSYKTTFENVEIPKDSLLGKAGNYYEQPAFSGGAVRFAAVQLGAAEMLVTQTVDYLQNLNRTEDPFQKMRVGEMMIAVTSGHHWIEGAAKELDRYQENKSDKNRENLLFYANMMRTATEEICLNIITLCQKCVGARGLNKPFHFERIIRDLSTYLRQPAPDYALGEVGRFVLQKPADGKKSNQKITEKK